jgi:hypothetical protein
MLSIFPTSWDQWFFAAFSPASHTALTRQL